MRDALSYFEQLGESYGRNLAQALLPRLAPAVVPAAAPPALARASRPVRARAVRAIKPNTAVTPGALVRYRQGRGTFDAEVVRVDEVTGMATLQRTLDGKRVLRPLDRVYL